MCVSIILACVHDLSTCERVKCLVSECMICTLALFVPRAVGLGTLGASHARFCDQSADDLVRELLPRVDRYTLASHLTCALWAIIQANTSEIEVRQLTNV